MISGVAAEPIRLESQVVSGFLEQHCVACHRPERQNGKLQLGCSGSFTVAALRLEHPIAA